MTRKKKRHSPEQNVKKLRDADAMEAAGKSLGLRAAGASFSAPKRNPFDARIARSRTGSRGNCAEAF